MKRPSTDELNKSLDINICRKSMDKLNEYPEMFKKWPNTRQNLLDKIKNKEMLKEFQLLLRKMFENVSASDIPPEFQNIVIEEAQSEDEQSGVKAITQTT